MSNFLSTVAILLMVAVSTLSVNEQTNTKPSTS